MAKKYDLKINIDLKKIFQMYLDKHPEYGYRSVSEYLKELIRNDAKRIIHENPEFDGYVRRSKREYVLKSALADYFENGLTKYASCRIEFEDGEIKDIKPIKDNNANDIENDSK